MRFPAFARLGILLGALPWVGVAQKVHVEFDQAADFSRYRSFMIRGGQIHSKSPALNSDLIRKQIEAGIRKNLAARGLNEAEGQPDLNVRYSLGSANKRETELYPAGWRGLGTRRVVVQYSEGTLVVDLRDARKHELVWRAIAVEDKSDPMKLQKRLDEMVRKAIEKYPPAVK